MSTPATAEEKTNKKNDVKARGLLLMALPNEHQLTFSQYPDAKSMFAAIETRFGGNAATKKTQKTLLKQQYENFSATSAESLDSIFNRLQKIVSRLAILGVIIAQEDLNLKFLSSLPPEWNTHVVVWMNKPEVETMSIDDLYNNFKIVEQKVKKTVGTSSGGQNLAFMTAPSSSSTNDANTACSQVSAASPSVNTASPQVCTASVSDNTVYAFMVENLNGSNVLHQDLEQFHEDDLEAMDLKWQLSLLSVRAKKYYQRTCKKIFINGNDIAGYDKSKVECYNCHKLGHFARECRAPRSKEGQFKNQDNTRKQGNNEDISKYDDLLAILHETEFKAATYKRGLATVEDQLVTFRKNEVLFYEEVVILKREVGCKQYEINMLKTEFEKVKQGKDGIDFKIKKFDKASKDLDQLLGSQKTDKSKKGLGYSEVPPPHPLIYKRPNKLDLSYSGLDEFKGYGPENSKQESNVVCENESDNSKENSNKSLVKEQVSQDKSSFVEGYGPNTSKSVSKVEPKKVMKNDGAPNIKDWVSDDEEQDESKPKSEKKSVIPTAAKKEFAKPKNHENPFKKSVRNMSPKAVLLKTGLTPDNTVRPVNTANPKIAVHTKRHYYTGRHYAVNTARSYSGQVNAVRAKPQHDDKGFVDSGCSRHITGNIAYLSDFKQFDGGYVAFGGGAYGGKITGKGTLKIDNLDFKDLPDENQILLKIPRKDNMYSFDMKNIVFKESLTCLVAKATLDESMLWHRRLGKQHRASCKSKVLNPITKPLFVLHMDLFGPTFDETSEILKNFIKEIENLVDKKVKIIRSDNGTEFKNKVMNDFCREKGIKREYSVVRTPQQNGIAERRNRTLARTMNFSNDFASNQGVFNSSSSSQQDQDNQDCIVMPIWKDASYFNLHFQTTSDAEPRSAADDQIKDKDGSHDENDDTEKSNDDSSLKDDTADQQVNTARPSHAFEDTQVESFNDHNDQEVELGKIPHSYAVPTTPNIRIHKDYPVEHVIGDIQSSIQIRRMITSYSKQGFLSAIYKGKSH
ncbi:putative ribonuclease H-like domain-containing protein [Tanacetum coccineum]